MLSLKECRSILGKKFEDYTDEQIRKIRDWLYQIVGLEMKEFNKTKIEHEKGHLVCQSKHRRAGR